MRRRLLIAVLLGSTMLAQAAHAGPLGAFLGGALNALGAGTWLASGAVGAWSAGFSVGTFLGGSLVGRAVLSIGLSAISNALFKPRAPSQPPLDAQANFAQPLTAMERVYGRVRKGGPLGFTGFSSGGVTDPEGFDIRGKRHYSVILAAHSIRGVVEHWLDKTPVEVVGNFVETAPFAADGEHHASIRVYLGHAGQTVDPILASIFPEVTSAYDFKGLAYAALYAARCKDSLFTTVYPNSRQWAYAPVIDGCDTVYDPRDATYGWTRNAALIIADLAVSYGYSVDWAEVAEEADICDQIITNGDGGSQRRWTINGSFALNLPWEDHRARLALACDAWFYERIDGSIGFKVGLYRVPSVTVVDRDLISLGVSEGQAGPDSNDEFCLRYVEPARDYEEATSGAYIIGDNRSRYTEEAYLIDSNNQAWRASKAVARAQRPRYRIKGLLKMIGYELIGQRFLRLTLQEMPVDLVVEIATLTREENAISFSFEGFAVSEADFAADPGDEPARPLRANVVNDDDVPEPVGLAGAAQSDGVAGILWSWTASSSDLRQQVQWRKSGDPDWQILTAEPGQTVIGIWGLVDGASYEAQIRNRTSAGRVSGWAPVGPITVVALANSVAPAAISSLAVTPSGGLAEVSWVAPNDPNYAGARIYRESYSGAPSFGSASLIHVEYGAASAADLYADNPASGDWAYWVGPINASGIEGPIDGPVTINIP